jgi:hypothetical protein
MDCNECEQHFCPRHSDVARATKFVIEYEHDLHKAPEHEKELCMKKLDMAIAILHQAISYNQEKLFKKYILKTVKPNSDLKQYEINTDDIPFTE